MTDGKNTLGLTEPASLLPARAHVTPSVAASLHSPPSWPSGPSLLFNSARPPFFESRPRAREEPSGVLSGEFGMETQFLAPRSSQLDASSEARGPWGCGADVATHIQMGPAGPPNETKQNCPGAVGTGWGRETGDMEHLGASRKHILQENSTQECDGKSQLESIQNMKIQNFSSTPGPQEHHILKYLVQGGSSAHLRLQGIM